MAKEIFTKSNLLFFGALILFAYLMWSWRGQVETITPGQELRAECVIDDNCPTDEICKDGQCESFYPKNGDCDGRQATIYGRPSFYTDPAMTHMVNMPCSNDDQCQHWPPLSSKGAATECCMNSGVCISYGQ